MKKNKCFCIIAATLLAVAPVAATGTTIVGNHVVKAADTNNVTKITFSLKKPTLTLQAHDDWDEADVAENVVKDIAPSTGKVDDDEINIDYYKKGADGEIDPVDPYDLKNGDEGVMVVSFDMKGLKEGTPYTFQSKTDDSGDLVWVDAGADDGYLDELDEQPAVKIPFVVGSKKSSKSNQVIDPAVKKITRVRKVYYWRGRITGRYNRKVRTYTSRGKFAHHYVYGRHTYKFNTRKVIKGKVYYKIYGKSQYVRASYIKF